MPITVTTVTTRSVGKSRKVSDAVWRPPAIGDTDGLVCQKAGVPCEYCGAENCECDDDMMVVQIADADYNDSFMYKLPNN